jgi:hypothetical protein
MKVNWKKKNKPAVSMWPHCPSSASQKCSLPATHKPQPEQLEAHSQLSTLPEITQLLQAGLMNI